MIIFIVQKTRDNATIFISQHLFKNYQLIRIISLKNETRRFKTFHNNLTWFRGTQNPTPTPITTLSPPIQNLWCNISLFITRSS